MTARITLALLFIVPAAMAYPWPSTFDRWLLGIAVAVVLVLFIGWRGAFFTTMVRRRLAIWRRRKAPTGRPDSGAATVVLRVATAEADGELPLTVIAGYTERYGLQADAVRVTSRDRAGSRTSWVSLTLRAVDNLDALRARSPRIPLSNTALVAARRLADHLREIGWHATIVEATDTPVSAGKETWRGVHDEDGYTAAYRIAVNDQLPDTLAAVRSHTAAEIWTAVEITGSTSYPTVTVGCALRTGERPKNTGPLPGLTPQRGRHRSALEALAPTSDRRLIGDPVPLPGGLLDAVTWPVTGPRGGGTEGAGTEAGGTKGGSTEGGGRHRQLAGTAEPAG